MTTKETLSHVLDEQPAHQKLKEQRINAKHTLQYYIDKNHPTIPEQCQVCGSTDQVGKVIPEPKDPLKINVLCQHCINNIFNHSGTPIADLPDTIDVQDLPKQPSLPNRATIRKKISSWRKRHEKELQSLRCQGCGISYSEKKLRLIPPDLYHPFTVNAVCPSCDYHFRQDDSYPEPINLLNFAENSLEREAEQARTKDLAQKTRTAITHTLKIFDIQPTRCSFCDAPLDQDYKTIIHAPGDTIHFYTVCTRCSNSPNFPQNYEQLNDALSEPDFVLIKGVYSISELISNASFDTS